MSERDRMLEWAAKQVAKAEDDFRQAETRRREWLVDVELLRQGKPSGRFQQRYWDWKARQPRE